MRRGAPAHPTFLSTPWTALERVSGGSGRSSMKVQVFLAGERVVTLDSRGVSRMFEVGADGRFMFVDWSSDVEVVRVDQPH